MSPLRRIVVVGASLAGLRAAEALRRSGYAGELVLVGDEPHLPYDRPPLTKQFLNDGWRPEQTALPVAPGLDATWRLGVPVTRLDVSAHAVHLADGARLHYDGAVLATGARARPWPGPTTPTGVHTIRGLDDAIQVAKALPHAGRLLIVGAGFLGGEVAAAARALGVPATLVESQDWPLLAPAGPHVGRFVAALHRAHGVDLRLGVRVRDFTGNARGELTGAELTDGTNVEADLAVLALGAKPNIEWLAGSGLITDGGLVCDEYCRPLWDDGRPAPDVVAAGDLARWPHPLAGNELISLGHWSNAVEQATAAAQTLLQPDTTPGYRPVPSFWSDLYGVRMRSVGLPHLADVSAVIEHDDSKHRLVVTYHRNGQLIGALTANRTSRLAPFRAEFQRHLSGTHPSALPA
ncbi:pyridine nucleotide-disulfide oxidoreductase [Micromonospora qiuiae]|uniref:Pyridine nucleotide-disulfide oxidoreductase n=1 Tax=Micromonospora qiuiae TaxID=502268 RepID=A0ABQ4JME5_9ACTN|nr:FAD-dependent oxidoreductase [Micromonospora qiuiae]GIJ30762.1 pyridine nucleotide-disulfide oxidoreductase [Micromonospora qiuiae]